MINQIKTKENREKINQKNNIIPQMQNEFIKSETTPLLTLNSISVK